MAVINLRNTGEVPKNAFLYPKLQFSSINFILYNTQVKVYISIYMNEGKRTRNDRAYRLWNRYHQHQTPSPPDTITTRHRHHQTPSSNVLHINYSAHHCLHILISNISSNMPTSTDHHQSSFISHFYEF